jgi:hypothetical protein
MHERSADECGKLGIPISEQDIQRVPPHTERHRNGYNCVVTPKYVILQRKEEGHQVSQREATLEKLSFTLGRRKYYCLVPPFSL